MRRPCADCERLPWSKHAPERRCICSGMNLDVGCSDHPQKGFLGMDRRDLPNVSFVWCAESVAEPPWWARQQFGAKAMSWPFPSNCVDKLLMSHLFEHITPAATVAVMNEVWRVMRWNGQALIVVPHGSSWGYMQDPTHCTPLNDASFAYFDPAHESQLWTVYKPLPWKIARLHSSPQHNIEVVLEPRKKADGSAVDVTIEKSKRKRGRK